MGLNKHLMLELMELEWELEDEDGILTPQREAEIKQDIAAIEKAQDSYNKMLREMMDGRK